MKTFVSIYSCYFTGEHLNGIPLCVLEFDADVYTIINFCKETLIKNNSLTEDFRNMGDAATLLIQNWTQPLEGIDKLEEELEHASTNEDYEKAASLRDQIKSFENSNPPIETQVETFSPGVSLLNPKEVCNLRHEVDNLITLIDENFCIRMKVFEKGKETFNWLLEEYAGNNP